MRRSDKLHLPTQQIYRDKKAGRPVWLHDIMPSLAPRPAEKLVGDFAGLHLTRPDRPALIVRD